MIKILKSVGLITVQDPGRLGFLKEGIPRSGWMDDHSAKMANQLVCNEDSMALLEGFSIDFECEVQVETRLAITGGEVSIWINNKIGRMNSAVKLHKGDNVRIRNSGQGWITYMAFSGGIEVNPVLGSRATYLPASFGGFKGRGLKKGDIFTLGEADNSMSGNVNTQARAWSSIIAVRIMAGPEWGEFSERDRENFLSGSYEIVNSSNRMGYRLEGEPLLSAGKIEPSPILPGTIQVPPDGQPIVLMSDCQTTGGYPRAGQVMEEDLSKFAQMKPGSKVRFRLVNKL